MSVVDKVIERVDRFQLKHRPTAFVVAVVKKFGDDQGGDLAAVITYYGFVSLFPLLLVFVTVLGFVLQNNPSLQHDLVTSAVANFPIVGDQITANVGSVQGNGIALVIGLLGTLYGGLGIARASQDAMNRVWDVPRLERPSFVSRGLRSLALIGTLGVAILGTTLLAAVGGGGSLHWIVRVVVIVSGLGLDLVLFAIAFRVLTARDLSWRDVLPGAAVAAVAWEVLQLLGGAYVSHLVQGMSLMYGTFAIVLGLLAWIFLQARVIVYAAEVNVVKAGGLWPRHLTAAPSEQDERRAEDDRDERQREARPVT